jgi:hypothetical protein
MTIPIEWKGLGDACAALTCRAPNQSPNCGLAHRLSPKSAIRIRASQRIAEMARRAAGETIDKIGTLQDHVKAFA